MRITYLHQYFNTPAMAGGTRSFEMARRLVAAGHQVTMITSSRDGRSERRFDTIESGIRVIWLPVRYSQSMSYTERIRSFVEFSSLASRAAIQVPADVIFATSTPLTIIIPAVLAAALRRAPIVFEVRDLWPELPIAMGALRGWVPRTGARMLERFAYAASRHIVVLSPGMRDGVLRTGAPDSKISVIPNSSDIESFAYDPAAASAFRARHDWLGPRPLVVYVGSLGRVNGVGYLAEVAAEALRIDPDVRFLVVGKGLEAAAVRGLADRLGVLNVNMFFHDPIPKRAVPEVLSAASIATSLCIDLPELEANSANKVFDAFAAGKPLAINYGGWQAELLTSSGAGVVLPKRDAAAAATTIVSALRDEKALARMAEASSALAHGRFNRDLLANQLQQVLLNATSGARKVA